MKIETIQKTEKIPELKDLELGVPAIPGIDNVENEHKEYFNVKYNNIPIKIEVITTSSSIIDGKMTRLGNIKIKINALTEDKKQVAKLDLYLRRKKDENNIYEMFAKIQKQGEEFKGQGLGRTLWEISLPLMQKFSDKFNAKVVHEVMEQPSEGLKREKWEELFLPLLRKYEYWPKGQPSDYLWEKTYSPSKK